MCLNINSKSAYEFQARRRTRGAHNAHSFYQVRSIKFQDYSVCSEIFLPEPDRSVGPTGNEGSLSWSVWGTTPSRTREKIWVGGSSMSSLLLIMDVLVRVPNGRSLYAQL
ncbi:hypothetical protein GOBAR_AA11712 [Gossypium barbadense]|uniref:Uncharacterized protein n=1 Tax=Gossypium barbadense TaxID=3634 RepID=A0A2P5Y016_GOSBA|nr:hypothetical protein GOBAR_AA11712 [Gossypium barbadense]